MGMSMPTPYTHYGTYHAMGATPLWSTHVPPQQWPPENTWEKPTAPPPTQKWKEDWCKQRETDDSKENEDWKERDSRDRDRDKKKTAPAKSKKKEKEPKVEEEEKTLDLDTR